MLRFVEGDLFHSSAQYIAQGVAESNQEGLGTGLALKISKRWPEVQRAFKRHARSRRFRGGDIWVSPPTDDRPGVVYLATQPDMYHATMPYLRKAIRHLARWSIQHSIPSVGLPKIGAGLGKLSWETEVKPVLIDQLTEPECQFLVYETYVPGDRADGDPGRR